MAHVGIERFSSGHHQEHGTKNSEACKTVLCEEGEGMTGIERAEDGRRSDNPDNAERGNCHKPENDDGTEESADTMRPELLNAEERDENRNSDRHDIRPEQRSHYFKTFDRTQH